MQKLLRWVLLSVIVLGLTACGGVKSREGSSTLVVPSAIEKIANYTKGTSTPPTLQQYTNAGISGVTENNLNEINKVLKTKVYTEVDTKEEIQTLVDALSDTTGTLANLIPTVTINDNNTTLSVGEKLILKALGTDSDGTVVAYEWKEGSKVLGDASSIEYTAAVLGEHNISVTVTDDDGATATANIVLSVVDKQVPVITLKGAAVITLHVGDVYKELGATANDVGDGNISELIEIDANTVNTSAEGNYTVTYNVKDSLGNTAQTVSRTVLVKATPLTREALLALISTWTNDPSKANAQAITDADTSQITDMSKLFKGNVNFNLDISKWDTSKVTSMYLMFFSAGVFNQSIETWNTSNVTNMSYMFHESTAFNQPIGKWDTSNVTNMSGMFSSTGIFNQSIKTWNTSNVTNMESMFNSAVGFNQDISNWDTSSVTIMTSMFYSATSFNNPLNAWNVDKVTDYRQFKIKSALEDKNMPSFK